MIVCQKLFKTKSEKAPYKGSFRIEENGMKLFFNCLIGKNERGLYLIKPKESYVPQGGEAQDVFFFNKDMHDKLVEEVEKQILELDETPKGSRENAIYGGKIPEDEIDSENPFPF